MFRFDLLADDMSRHEELEVHLRLTFSRWEDLYGCNPMEDTLSSRIRGLIKRAVEQTALTIDDNETNERM